MRAGALAILLGLVGITMCGGTSSDATCAPGQSIACGGPNGCSGFQVCQSDGTYAPCSCGGADAGVDAPTPSDGSPPKDASGDGAGDADGDVTPPPDASNWTPQQLSGLALWLDDTVGVVADPQNPGQIKRWLDQSGNGNDATGQCTNACPGDLPDLDPVAINGHDAITCGSTKGSGTGFYIADAPSLRFGTGDFGIAIVYVLAPAASNGGVILFGKTDSADPVLALTQTTGNNVTFTDGINMLITTVSATQKFQYFIARGTALSLQSSAGNASGPTTTNNVDNTNALINICDNRAINSGYGEVAEVIAVKGTLPAGDVTNLVAYFHKKFGL